MELIASSLVLGVVFLVIAFSIAGTFVPFAVGDYSDGARQGLLNKFSKKGVICKTYEGYLLVGNGQNIQPETWYFTVKDEKLAQEITSKVGQNIQLQYSEKLYASGCWGETGKEVIGVK